MLSRLSIPIFFLSLLIYPVLSESCISCHGNKELMEELGYPQFYFTLEEVRKQSGMPTVKCSDCHLGNPNASLKEEAHRGMVSLYVIGKKEFKILDRREILPFLKPRNDTIMKKMLPKDKRVVTILYHDKDPDLFTFNKEIVKKTCGKCHPKEVEEFSKTTMGTNRYQSMYKSWIESPGPHNCGPWFLAWYENIKEEINVNYTLKQVKINQKACNRCHVSCLDCHYAPFKNEGVHKFERKPSPISCYGGGRGSICHAGPEERRRGAGYLGGEFSFPKGREPDVHVKYGLTCIDCHDPLAKGGMGGIKREVSCAKCHEKIAQALKLSSHAKVSCEACHILDAGGYQLTVWGPGKVAGVFTPFKKYRAYYGTISKPLLIKDKRGIWIPVKPFPMVVVNIKKDVERKPGVIFRRAGSKDAYALIGTYDGLPRNNKALLWFQMDKLSHSIRKKARSCESCHNSSIQILESRWKFTDQGAEPFEGKHIIIGNSSGLYVIGLTNTTPIIVKKGWSIADLAPWYYLKDKFYVKGNFALPEIDRVKYEKELRNYKKFLSEITNTKKLLEELKGKGFNVTDEMNMVKDARIIGVHNPEEGLKIIENIKKKIEIKKKEYLPIKEKEMKEKGICGPSIILLIAILIGLIVYKLRRYD